MKTNVIKRITGAVLAAVLGTAALTGCGAGNSSTASTSTSKDESGATESKTSSATTESTASASGEKKTVKLGILSGADEDIWKPIKEELAKENIDLEIKFFTDYPAFNKALNDGDIDINAFQHHKYFNEEVEQFKYDIVPIADTYISATNIYSNKVKDVKDIKEGDKIAVANDASNEGRALRVLQAAGLIKVDDSKGILPTKADITENPLNLDIVEVEASQTPSLLPDVAAAVINGDFAVAAGLSPINDSIFQDDPANYPTNDYVNLIAARTKDKDDPTLKRIVEVYQSKKTEEVYKTVFEGTYLPTWKTNADGASSAATSEQASSAAA